MDVKPDRTEAGGGETCARIETQMETIDGKAICQTFVDIFLTYARQNKSNT